MEKFLKLIRQHCWFLLYCAGALVVLLCLNQWLWPTPDEYYYASLAQAFTGAQHGLIAWKDIDTEHVGFIPYLVFLFSWLTGATSFATIRIPIIGFSLGIIILLYVLAHTLRLPNKHRFAFLWLLLLIPGFWIFSVRFMLDIPATFGILLLLWLLIKKAPIYQVALAIGLLLIIKEHYVYITMPLVVLVYGFDNFIHKKKWYWAILRWGGQVGLVYLPTFVITVLLVDFYLFPYPRLLENSLMSIFGDIFTAINKMALSLVQQTIVLVNHLQSAPPVDSVQPVLTNTPVTIPDVVTNTVVVTPPVEIISSAPVPIVEPTPTIAPTVDTLTSGLDQKINDIAFTGKLPIGAFESPIPAVQHSFFEKIWLIYRYNFSESDINVFILPLSVLGIAVTIQTMWKNGWRQFTKMRGHCILGFFLLMMLYFNWHEANNIHGFRVNIPIIIPLLYFAYLGLQQLLQSYQRSYAWAFATLMLGSCVLYYFTLADTVYGSILAQAGWVATAVQYKPYLFIALFIGLTLGLIIFPLQLTQYRWKYIPLISLVIGLFIIKIIPFYIEYRKDIAFYGYDYGLAEASPLLADLVQDDEKIYSNVHNYTVQYYAHDWRISNVDMLPLFRPFGTQYPVLYYVWPVAEDLLTNLKNRSIHYVFIVNDDYGQADLRVAQAQIATQSDAFRVVASHYQGARLQWILYSYTY